MRDGIYWLRTGWGRVALSLSIYFLLVLNMFASNWENGNLQCISPRAGVVALTLIFMLPVVSLLSFGSVHAPSNVPSSPHSFCR